MPKLSFRDFIESEYQRRAALTPGYSLRSYARDLEITPQKLNQILKGRSGLSSASAHSIAKHLNLDTFNHQLFIALVESAHHRLKSVRLAAVKKVGELLKVRDFESLGQADAGIYSKWYYLACYMLVDLVHFRPSMDWIASTLGITPYQAKEAYDRLFELGLLRDENGKWIRDSSNYTFAAETSSDVMQEYYRQMWSVANEKLTTEPVDKRQCSATVISVAPGDFEFVRDEINLFRKQLLEKVRARGGNNERVYALSMQLFPLDSVAPQKEPDAVQT